MGDGDNGLNAIRQPSRTRAAAEERKHRAGRV